MISIFVLRTNKGESLAEITIELSNREVNIKNCVNIKNYSRFLLSNKFDNEEVIQAFDFIDEIQVFFMEKIKNHNKSIDIIKNMLSLIANYFNLVLESEIEQ